MYTTVRKVASPAAWYNGTQMCKTWNTYLPPNEIHDCRDLPNRPIEVFHANTETESHEGHFGPSKSTERDDKFISAYTGCFLPSAVKAEESSLYLAVKRVSKTPVSIDVTKVSDWNRGDSIAVIHSENNKIRGQKKQMCVLGKGRRASPIHRRNALLVPSWTKVMTATRAYSSDSTGVPETPFYRSKTAYYDILQVSSTATQAQIKTAYYKQSFIYHPDRNAGSDEATQRFSEISEAYTVLGNRALKKKYDRGILSHGDVHGARRPSEKEAPSSSTTAQRSSSRYSPMSDTGGKPVFDFDAFFKAHYGEQLQREKDLRWRREQMQRKREEGYKGWKLGKMTEISVGFLLALGMTILFSMSSGG